MYPHPKIRLWIMLTFDKVSGHANMWLDEPSQRHLLAKCDTISGHCNEKPHVVIMH